MLSSIILNEPAIIFITSVFLMFFFIVFTNYLKIAKNLKTVYNFLHEIDKKEISYRFQHLDELMSSNTYTNTSWEDFKKALVFPEKFYITDASKNSANNFISDIYLTIDASYFFNEETLIYSKINNKFIQAMPTILTGLGPFFTFLKLTTAFSAVDLTASDVNASLNSLLSNIQIAALCSVFAVGYSLLFMLIEKLLYNANCKKYYILIQKEFIRLFDVCTSEQFLLDLVKESKLQNTNSVKMLQTLPENMAKEVAKSIGEITTPYLENILYSLNKLNETNKKNSDGDVVDKLF